MSFQELIKEHALLNTQSASDLLLVWERWSSSSSNAQPTAELSWNRLVQTSWSETFPSYLINCHWTTAKICKVVVNYLQNKSKVWINSGVKMKPWWKPCTLSSTWALDLHPRVLGDVPALEVIGFLAYNITKEFHREQSTAEPTNLTEDKFPNNVILGCSWYWGERFTFHLLTFESLWMWPLNKSHRGGAEQGILGGKSHYL